MDYKIKGEEIFGIELQLVAIADYQFVVSADRIIPSAAHEGGSASTSMFPTISRERW